MQKTKQNDRKRTPSLSLSKKEREGGRVLYNYYQSRENECSIIYPVTDF